VSLSVPSLSWSSRPARAIRSADERIENAGHLLPTDAG